MGLGSRVFGDSGFPHMPVGMGWARRQRHTRIPPQPWWDRSLLRMTVVTNLTKPAEQHYTLDPRPRQLHSDRSPRQGFPDAKAMPQLSQ